MINKILHFSIRNKLIVILLTLSIAAYGVYAVFQIPVGAVPDITNNQVQVITVSSNLATQDVERFITYPVELEMANLPGVREIRSISKFGLSVVTIVFDDNLGTYLPRQLIAEKIKTATANIPEGFGTPEMGPITTGLGEIYQYILDVKPGFEHKYSAMDMRTIQDWIVKRQLSGIPGVVEINTWGGLLKQYEIAVNQTLMKQYNITLPEVFEAISKNSSVAGGAYIEKLNQSYFIRGDGMVKSIEDIGAIVVKSNEQVPILIRDIAEVRFGFANRYGAITANGEGEKVMGQIMMLKNANSKKVIADVKKRISEVQSTLPEGVYINPVIERSELIGKTSFTIIENLVLGSVIVMIIVIILLGNIRSALVIASMIPLALLFTISLMYIFGIDANLMSLGALDFGIIIDGAVIIVEFIAVSITANKLKLQELQGSERQSLMDSLTFEGASRMINSAIFGQLIILIVLIPILSLQGVEGKMFRPMAISFGFAIIGAMFLGFTWLPVATSLFLKPVDNQKSIANWLMKWIYKMYEPSIKWAYAHKRIVLGAAIVSLIITGILFGRIGGEFVPTLDEGDYVIQPVLKTGTSLSKTIELTTKMESILKSEFPDEVEQVVSRIGAAEVPTDPMSMEEIDMIIKLKPSKNWVKAENKEELAEKFKEALSIIPGIEYEFTQPIEMRFNELITGVRADVAVKVFGEDMEYLNKKAIEIKKLIQDIPGAADVILEKTAGLPQMSVEYNREKIAFYGLNIEQLNTYLAMAFGGQIAGSVFEGEKRFDMAIRLPLDDRNDIENIRNLYIGLPNGQQIPISQVAKIEYTTGPAKISRDNTHRRVVVSVNVRNRDLQSVVNDIQQKLNSQLKLQPGYYVVYGGQFENLQNATQRLLIVVPIALLLIFIFLHFAFGSFRDALLIFTAVPLSAVGGVAFLWLRDMPFSVSAGVGFIALFGVAVLNGIVLIEYLKELEEHGLTDMRELILKATRDRLRPVLLTASAAALGFLPMAISTSAGAEVQRPLATVVIGGLITSTLLTLIALPLLYSIFGRATGIQIWPPKILHHPKTITLILVLILPGMSTQAQNTGLSLQKAIQTALANNSTLKVAQYEVEQSKALQRSAFQFDKTEIYYGTDQNNIAENGHPLNVIGAQQSFAFPGTYFSAYQMGKYAYQMKVWEYETQKNILQKEVSQSYYRIQYLIHKLQLISQIDSAYANVATKAKQSYQMGQITKLDYLNAEARIKKWLIEQNVTKNEINAEYFRLKTLMQTDSSFEIQTQNLEKVIIQNPDISKIPEMLWAEENLKWHKSQLKLHKQNFLPEINMNIYKGTNSFAGAQNYWGYEVGVVFPLFYTAQKAETKAVSIASGAAAELQLSYQMQLQIKVNKLSQELESYNHALLYYAESGNELANTLADAAQKSFLLGEINFYQYSQSMENSIEIRLEYLENLNQYNQTALELNYLTR